MTLLVQNGNYGYKKYFQRQSDLLSSLTKILDDKIAPINQQLQKLDQIEKSLGDTNANLKKVIGLKATVDNLKADLGSMDKKLLEVQIENKSLKEKILYQELYSRKNNIKILGFKALKPEDLENALLDILNDVGVELTPKDIERVHFVGPDHKKQARPVLMRLINVKDKFAIMDKRTALKEKGFVIFEDYPKEITQRRSVILPIFFKALQVCPNLKPKLLTDKMILGGKMYTIDNIHTIPVEELLPTSVFTPRQGNVTAFFTKSSPLSNHYPTTFIFEGKQYKSSEQCFMFQKAIYFGDNDAADRIMKSNDPAEAKQIGKRIANFNARMWAKVAEDCLFKAVLAKFSQSVELANFLKAAENTKLVEASPSDKHWGVGMPLRDRNVFNEEMWKGKNTAGVILSRVRNEIMAKV